MLNIGTGEILLICVAALLILGPKRLPETARSIGRFLRKFQRQTNAMRSLVEREFLRMDLEENNNTAQEAMSAPKGMPPSAPAENPPLSPAPEFPSIAPPAAAAPYAPPADAYGLALDAADEVDDLSVVDTDKLPALALAPSAEPPLAAPEALQEALLEKEGKEN